MRKLTLFAVLLSSFSFGQCISVDCQSNVTLYTEATQCGVPYNYVTPVFTNICNASGTETFVFTGTAQQYTVPAGVTTITIETWGAQGGANWVDNNNFGGYNKADFSVTPGEILTVYVGGQATSVTGGFNGGGNGDAAGKGGGGASDVRRNGTTLTDRIIVSGGGGGAGYWSGMHIVGGIGGGTNGGDGYRGSTVDMGGVGATTTGPGPFGTCINYEVTSMAGSLGNGGSPAGFNCSCEGYGGGGGYFGGAGSGNCRGGGGGSGFIAPGGTNISSVGGVRTGNGQVIITYGNGASPSVAQLSGLASGTVFPVGITTNTFQGTLDATTLDCSYTVTVIDTIVPVLNTPINSITLDNDPGLCVASFTLTPIDVTDNCGIASLTNDAPMSFPVGTTMVTWLATDVNGNSKNFYQQVNVVDLEGPTFNPVLDPLIVCEGVLEFDEPSYSDNCAAAVTQLSGPAFGDLVSVGSYDVTFQVEDQGGNTDLVTFTIEVNQNPNATLNITLPSETICANYAAFELNGADPVGGTWSGTGVNGTQFNPADAEIGDNIVMYTVTEISTGCSTTVSDLIIVSECLSIGEDELVSLSIFPNPANDILYIICPEAGTLTLFDAQGKLVYKNETDKTQNMLKVSDFANGIYTLIYENKDNRKVNQKISIQH